MAENKGFQMDLPMGLGAAGSLLLCLGVFMPLVKMPIVGDMNYFMNGKGDGVYVLGIGAVSLVLALARLFWPLLVTGLISGGIMGYTYHNLTARIDEMKKIADQTDGALAKGLADAVANSVQIQFGFAVLALGAVLLIVAPIAAMQQSGFQMKAPSMPSLPSFGSSGGSVQRSANEPPPMSTVLGFSVTVVVVIIVVLYFVIGK